MPTYNYSYRNVDWDAGTFKMALLTSDYVPSRSHAFFDDVSANEASGTNYTAGGATLANPAVTRDASGYRDQFSSDAASWTALTCDDIRYGVVYEDTGDPATSVLIAWFDLVQEPEASETVGPYSPVAADCSVAPSSLGWVDDRYET